LQKTKFCPQATKLEPQAIKLELQAAKLRPQATKQPLLAAKQPPQTTKQAPQKPFQPHKPQKTSIHLKNPHFLPSPPVIYAAAYLDFRFFQLNRGDLIVASFTWNEEERNSKVPPPYSTNPQARQHTKGGSGV